MNTICYPTKRNQEQIKDLAKKAGIMIIIGSFTSANSKRLRQLSLDYNLNSYQVTTPNQLRPQWFVDKELQKEQVKEENQNLKSELAELKEQVAQLANAK